MWRDLTTPMSGDDTSFDALMAQLRAGEERAAETVFRQFVHRLVALARSQFDSWVRDRADPEGVVQSVFKSFFVRHHQGEIECESWNELWALLALITQRKCVNRNEYLRAECRNVAREVAVTWRGSDESGVAWDAPDRQPTPAEAAMLADTVEAMLCGLDPPERAIIEQTLQGYTVPEIARNLGRSERTVWRVRQRVRQRLAAIHSREGDA